MLKYNRLSDYKIKKLMRRFCVDIPATKAALLLNMNRNTTTRFFRLFREAIWYHQEKEFKEFVGEIELDESYFGARRKRGFKGKLKRGRGTQKQPIFGILVRNGKVYTEIIPNCKKKTLDDIIFPTNIWFNYDLNTQFIAKATLPGSYSFSIEAEDNGTPNAPVMEPCVVNLTVTETASQPLPVANNISIEKPNDEGQGSDLWWWYLEGHYYGQLSSISADTEMKRISVRVGVPDSKLKRIKTTENTSGCTFESFSDIPITMLDGSSKDSLANAALSNTFIPGFKKLARISSAT